MVVGSENNGIFHGKHYILTVFKLSPFKDTESLWLYALFLVHEHASSIECHDYLLT